MALRIAQAALLAGVCMAPLAHSADGPLQSAPVTDQAVSRFARDASWLLRLPEDDKVAFAGAVSLDQAGLGTGQILYPVPGLVGLFAAIVWKD